MTTLHLADAKPLQCKTARPVYRAGVVLLATLIAWPALARSDDAVELDRYLQRLGLTDLRLVHAQQQLALTGEPAEKAAQAKQLSDLYAQRLLETADEPVRFGELVARVERLVRDFPAVDSPQLQVMLLQAQYQQAEVKSLRWVDDPTDAAARSEAQQLLQTIVPQLADRHRELLKALEDLQAKADAIEEVAPESKRKRATPPGNTISLEQEMTRLQAVLARATFFEGWANFFTGLLAEGTDQQPHFQAAEKAFGQLLEISTEKELSFEPETMGLESVWRARSLMGLGASLSAVDKEELARECFAALEHPSTATAVREAALYWHLLALVGSQQWETARELASGEISKFTPAEAASRTPACVLMVRAGWANPKAPKEAHALTRLGLEGLARLKQFDLITALLAKYRSEPQATDGFYALWAKGRLMFAAAEKSKRSDDFQQAGKWFQQALDLPEAKDDLTAAAQCRYSLAWCDYRQEHYEAALRLFRLAAAQLRTLGDETAVQSAWMVFTCYQQLHSASKDPRHQKEALAALADLKRDFPGTDQAQRADLMLARLKVQGDAPEEAVKTLSAVSPDSPSYLTARYELCAARHQLWTKSRGQPNAASLAAELIKDVDAYLVAAPESEGVRRVRAALLAVDVLLASDSPDWEAAARYLDRVRAAGDKLGDDDSIAPEYHYQRLQLAQHAKDEAEARSQAAWLAKHAAGTNYELPAMVIVARTADDSYAAASAAQKDQRRESAIATYQRLVQLLGDSPDVIGKRKNALIANSKLAQYEYDAGRYSAAAQRLDRIVQAHPDNRNYLRRAGLAWFQAGEPAKSLEHWTTVAAGSDSASEAWYEAKYYQLSCLAKTDTVAANQSWRQFKLLHPEVKDAAWGEKFAALEKTAFASK